MFQELLQWYAAAWEAGEGGSLEPRSDQTGQNSKTLSQKLGGQGMAQVVEHLPSKHKT
jgi:hypothetical protein